MKIDISLYKINHMKKYFFILLLAVGCSKDEQKINELYFKGQKIDVSQYTIYSTANTFNGVYYTFQIGYYQNNVLKYLIASRDEYNNSIQVRPNDIYLRIPILKYEPNRVVLDTGLIGTLEISPKTKDYSIKINMSNSLGSKVVYSN